MEIDQIIEALEARVEALAEEHGRIERALAELRPADHSQPPPTRVQRKRRPQLSQEDVHGRVAAALRGSPDEHFTIGAMCARVDYSAARVQRALKELVDAGECELAPPSGKGHAANFPTYRLALPLAAQMEAAR